VSPSGIVGDIVGPVVADQAAGHNDARIADTAGNGHVAQNAGPPESYSPAQAELLQALDSDPAAQSAGETNVAEHVAQGHDLAVDAARGHVNAAETGQQVRRLGSIAQRPAGIGLDDADVFPGGDNPVQAAVYVHQAYQVLLADD